MLFQSACFSKVLASSLLSPSSGFLAVPAPSFQIGYPHKTNSIAISKHTQHCVPLVSASIISY